MSEGLDIAKAGWLHRQSTVLHRWKKNWFVLYRDGVLRYFESQDSARAEEVYVLRSCCVCVKTSPELQTSASPPDGVSSGKACMLELVMRDGGNLLLCAESIDDMKAWQYALEEARTMAAGPGAAAGYTRTVPIRYEGSPYDPYYYGYGGYPGQVINPAPGTQVIRNPDGTTTIISPGTGNQVVYVDDSPYYRRRHYGYGAGTGLLTGAVIGSALMWPWFWF
ncbi:pleckstrin homology domain-containing family B member 2-like [Babylonia areolata]|uniref:pleckstrin homology domain-containing family B member 2-like n=1 Tax=Babylonia areolata TaxID=304850 RepID=UPI003FD37D70